MEMEISELFSKNMDKEMKNNIKNIINNSFKQEDDRKTVYVSNQLKKLYNQFDWNVLFIHQKDNHAHSYTCFGRIFICKYNDRRIIIFPSKIEEGSSVEKEDFTSSNKKISDMQIKLKENEKTIDKYKSKIEELKLKLNENNIQLESFQKIIYQKEKEILNLKTKMKKYNGNNISNQTFYSRDQILALNFISSDQRLHFALPCIKNDLFVDVEKKLYEQFPEYKETNNNFLVNAKMILRFKTIEENKLESGIPILIIPNKNN